MFSNSGSPNTLDIFTDASLRNITPDEVWTCAGALGVINGTIVDQDYRVYKNATSNFTEIKAVKLGVDMALRLLNYGYGAPINTINLFSDSQISIFGIRDRIFNWRIVQNELVGYGNKVIANQELILEIVNMIVNSELKINFYHQKGHSDQISIEKSQNSFIVSNRAYGAEWSNVTLDFVKYINRYNQMIDNYSRVILYKNIFPTDITSPITFPILSDALYQKSLDNYKQLINKEDNNNGKEK